MSIPKATAAGALAVSDGMTARGSIVERDGSFFAFNADGVLVGEFPALRQAMRAVPPAMKSSARAGAATASCKPQRRTKRK